MVIQCQWCGKENRVPDDPEPGAWYRCGDCKTELHIVWENAGSTDSLNAERHQPQQALGNPSQRHISKAPAIVSLVFLLLAVFGRWPYGFYTLLRFAVCGSCLYLVLQAYELKKFVWAWIMAAMVVLFNPLIPIRLPRDAWQAIDLIAAVVLAVSLLTIRRPRSQSV